MDFLMELLVDLLFETPLDMVVESKRVKPWVKTLVVFLAGNLLTVLLLLIAADASGSSQEAFTGNLPLVFALCWFAVVLLICCFGHRRRWWVNQAHSIPRSATPVRNAANPEVVIRTATMADLDAIAAVEAECFPPAEAATREEFRERLVHYGDHFWLMFEGEKLISFVDGFVTDEPDLRDEMYANAALHDPAGEWQMIFGVNTIPSHRCHGYAGQLMEQAILDARTQGRKGLVLTCKPDKVTYYMKFGFVNEGISQNSTHGGVVWHQMRLTF